MKGISTSIEPAGQEDSNNSATPDDAAHQQQQEQQQNLLCRFCLADDEDESQLVCCCGCKGTIQSVHSRCLTQWQHTLWLQGQFSRALRCDICCQPYQHPQQQQQQQAHNDGQLSLWQQLKARFVQLQNSPERAFRAWRCCILLGGLAAGTHHGVSGFGAGLNLGLRLAKPLASFTFRLMPQLSVAAAVLPSLAPTLRNALHCSCSLMLLEVVLTTAAGLFGGGLVGFCLGTVGVMKLSAKMGCQAAAVAAKVAAGASRAAWPRALALMLLKGGKGQVSSLLLLRRRHRQQRKPPAATVPVL